MANNRKNRTQKMAAALAIILAVLMLGSTLVTIFLY